MTKQHEETLSVAQAAKTLGIRLDTAYAALWTGRLRGEKRDGMWRVQVSAVEEYRARRTLRAKPAAA